MGLTPEEDADLRRLAVFERCGFLTVTGRARMAELRRRDRRAGVRAVETVAAIANSPYLGTPPRGQPCWVYPDDPRLAAVVLGQRKLRARLDSWHRPRALGH